MTATFFGWMISLGQTSNQEGVWLFLRSSAQTYGHILQNQETNGFVQESKVLAMTLPSLFCRDRLLYHFLRQYVLRT